MTGGDGPPRVSVPADLERPEPVLAGLGLRQLPYLGLAIVGVGLGALGPGHRPLRVLVGVLLAAVGTAAALLTPGGRPLEAWVPLLWAYRRRARRRGGPARPGGPPESPRASSAVCDTDPVAGIPVPARAPDRPRKQTRPAKPTAGRRAVPGWLSAVLLGALVGTVATAEVGKVAGVGIPPSGSTPARGGPVAAPAAPGGPWSPTSGQWWPVLPLPPDASFPPEVNDALERFCRAVGGVH